MATPMWMVNSDEQRRFAARRISQQAAHWHALFVVALEDEQLITEAQGDALVAAWDDTPWEGARPVTHSPEPIPNLTWRHGLARCPRCNVIVDLNAHDLSILEPLWRCDHCSIRWAYDGTGGQQA